METKLKKLHKQRYFLILAIDSRKKAVKRWVTTIILFSFFPLFHAEFFQLLFCELFLPWALVVGDEKTHATKTLATFTEVDPAGKKSK